MGVAFHGTEETVLSFEAENVTGGWPVGISRNNQVGNAADGQEIAGVALDVRTGYAAVQMKGYLELTYTGAAPGLGWQNYVANGTGGLRLAASGETGRHCLTVNVDTAYKTVGLYL